MVKNPVLFETYIRVDTARKVWEQIKVAQPLKLYFYSNKALISKSDDVRKNNEIRSWVKEVDWPCEVHTFFREEQVDQYTSLLGSKQWLFENEETGIILEDDCVPSMGFFEYCDHFLEVYKDEKKISFISGNNYSVGYTPKEGINHIISRSQVHFGWCTWKDRFDAIDFNLKPSDVIKEDAFHKYYNHFYISWYYKLFFNRLENFISSTKCWDYVWTLNCVRNQWYVVTPIFNLVQNIGLFGEHANGGDSLMFKLSSNESKKYKLYKSCKLDIRPDDDYDFSELRFFGRTSWKAVACFTVDFIKFKIGGHNE